VIALFVAITVGYIVRNLHPILVVFIADISGTLVVYSFGRVFPQCQFLRCILEYSATGYFAFLGLGASADSMVIARQIIVTGLVFVWRLRLTYNWARQWQGLKHEDWRYQDLRKKSPRWFWLIDLVGIEIMPTMIVFLACLSLYPALAVGEKTIRTA